MQAHSAPLGMTFFRSNAIPAQCSGTFPPDLDGDLFVGFHGSWNRDIPTGYKVVHVPFDAPGGSPTGGVNDLLRHDGSAAKWPSDVRPVDVIFDRCGRLLVSDDGAGYIFTISFDSGNNIMNRKRNCNKKRRYRWVKRKCRRCQGAICCMKKASERRKKRCCRSLPGYEWNGGTCSRG